MASRVLDPLYCPSLRGSEGELYWVQIWIEPRALEQLLEALSTVSFPINPEIHHPSARMQNRVVVEFPAYSGKLNEVYNAADSPGLTDAQIHVQQMMAHIKTPA